MPKLSRKRKGSYKKYNDPKNTKAKSDKVNAKKMIFILMMM